MADSSGKDVEVPSSSTQSTNEPSAAKPTAAGDNKDDDVDSDPDFDDLDDVLDQFSANAPNSAPQKEPSAPQESSQPVPDASGPGRPSGSSAPTASQNDIPIPSGPLPNESESDFIARLSKEMSTMLDSFSADPAASTQSPEDIAKMGKELEEFTRKMEEEGIQPEDLLKAILGKDEGGKLADLAHAERENLSKAQPSSSTSAVPPPLPQSPQQAPVSTSVPQSPTAASKASGKSFEDTIRSTMSRLGESDKSATTAAQQQSSKKSEEDLLADMLRALESSGGLGAGESGGSGEDGLSKMFLDMMQQLTHKDLLYEPMKELNDQYPAWLEKNKSSISTADYERYKRQSTIVADITRKFEEPGFSDDDPNCKEFIWDRMQKMQEEGAPPEELVKNPLPGTDLSGIPGLGGGPGGGGEIPEELSKELEEGCPTQ